MTLLVGRQEGHPACKKQWWGAGVVICLECSADLHMFHLMPLPLTVSCFSKIRIGFTFLVPAHLVIPGKRAVKRVCVCVCVCVCVVSEDVHCVVVAELSLLSRLSTLRYPHLLLSAGEPAARRLHRPQQSIDSSCLHGAQQQTRRPLSTDETDKRTDDRPLHQTPLHILCAQRRQTQAYTHHNT